MAGYLTAVREACATIFEVISVFDAILAVFVLRIQLTKKPYDEAKLEDDAIIERDD